MSPLSKILFVMVAALHVWFMVLETFLWKTPAIGARFGLTPEAQLATAPLAFNQGFYNLFLAAGLVFAMFQADAPNFPSISVFFLVCIVVAGCVGGLTVNPRIFVIQAVPAVAAMLSLFLR